VATLRTSAPIALASTLLALAAVAPAAQAQKPPRIPSFDTPILPNLPKPDDTVKYKFTLSGSQNISLGFRFDASSPNCRNEQSGEITENWDYKRGKGVVMVFKRYGKNVLLNRQGRKTGDAAFGTTGHLVRIADGSRNTCTGGYQKIFQDPTCNRNFNVPRDLRFAYQKGKLIVEASGRTYPNPTEPCTKEADVITHEYPTFLRATSAVTRRSLFGRKKGFKLKFKAPKQVAPFPAPYTTITRFSATNEFELTLTRIR